MYLVIFHYTLLSRWSLLKLPNIICQLQTLIIKPSLLSSQVIEINYLTHFVVRVRWLIFSMIKTVVQSLTTLTFAKSEVLKKCCSSLNPSASTHIHYLQSHLHYSYKTFQNICLPISSANQRWLFLILSL
jgi:hypothetical protein